MFRTSLVHHQGDSCTCNMVRFTSIGVSSMVDRRVALRMEPRGSKHVSSMVDRRVALRMEPRGSKHVRDNKNYKLYISSENFGFRWFLLYNCRLGLNQASDVMLRFTPYKVAKQLSRIIR